MSDAEREAGDRVEEREEAAAPGDAEPEVRPRREDLGSPSAERGPLGCPRRDRSGAAIALTARRGARGGGGSSPLRARGTGSPRAPPPWPRWGRGCGGCGFRGAMRGARVRGGGFLVILGSFSTDTAPRS